MFKKTITSAVVALGLCLAMTATTLTADIVKLNVLGTASPNGYVDSDSGISGSGGNADPADRISSLNLVWNSLDIGGGVLREVRLGIDGDRNGDVDIQDVGGTDNGLNVWGAVNRPAVDELFKVTIGIFDGATDVTGDYTIALSNIEAFNQDKPNDLAFIIGSSKFEFNRGGEDNTNSRDESTLIIGGPAAISGGAFDIDHTAGSNGQLLHLDGIEFTVSASAIPEPSSMGLLAIGGMSMMIMRRRRRG